MSTYAATTSPAGHGATSLERAWRDARGVAPDGRSRLNLPGVLTYGFGTTVAMWVIAFVMHIPFAAGDATVGLSVATFFVLLTVLAVGALRAGQAMAPGWRAGLATGLMASLLNLLVLAGVPSDATENLVALLAGSVVIGGVVGAIAGHVGNFRPRPLVPERHLVPRQGAAGTAWERNWRGPLAKVSALAVLAMLVLGGLVTSLEEGLSVPDWPTTEGYTMIFYPLSKMTGGIYYEHSHRLFGVLIGQITAVLGFYLLFVDRRRYVKGLAVAAMALVIVQAVLGGKRVVTSPDAGANAAEWAVAAQARGGVSLAQLDMQLAVLHGVLGQVFFGLILILAAVSSTTWRRAAPAVPAAEAGSQRMLGIVLLIILLLQISLGAVLRHVGGTGALHGHIMLGVIAALFAMVVGMRSMARYRGSAPALHKLGKLLTIHAAVIVPFGFLAWAAGGGQPNTGYVSAWQATAKTFHQLLGAMVLGLAVLLIAWSFRLLKKPDAPPDGARPTS